MREGGGVVGLGSSGCVSWMCYAHHIETRKYLKLVLMASMTKISDTAWKSTV
jgi:hypothetical protein